MHEPRGAGATQVNDVGKVFSSNGEPNVVLRRCSFDIEPGKLTVLLGPSGSGKTTLVKLIAGFDRPSVGEIVIDGTTVAGPGNDRMVVFQETALFPWMTLLENVAFGPIERGFAAAGARAEANALLAKAGLDRFADRYPKEVSAGMRRRAEVARALINKPALLLLDEPFSDLDHMSRGLMQEYLVGLFEEARTTTLFVTSDVDEAMFLADRVVVLSYKPGRVKKILDVPLARPREAHMQMSDTYVDLKREALDILYDETLKGFVHGTEASYDTQRVVSAAKADR